VDLAAEGGKAAKAAPKSPAPKKTAPRKKTAKA
jgi:hypothetical protein